MAPDDGEPGLIGRVFLSLQPPTDRGPWVGDWTLGRRRRSPWLVIIWVAAFALIVIYMWWRSGRGEVQP